MITGIYLALLAIAQCAMVFWIAKSRMRAKISLGDGGDDTLNRRIRVYGNFTEVVPMAILLMAVAEYSGAPLIAIHAMGLTIIAARILHAIGITNEARFIKCRMLGMLLTLLVYLIGAALCLFFGFNAAF